MDDTEIVMERKLLLEQKQELQSKLDALPLTSEEQQEKNERDAKWEGYLERRNRCAAIIVGMIIVGFGVALLMSGIMFIYARAAGCHAVLFNEHVNTKVECNSAPMIIAAIFGFVGVIGCAFAAGS